MSDYSMTKPGARPMDAKRGKSDGDADDKRSASPRAYNTSGIENAMHDHANQLHPKPAPKARKRSNVP